MNGATMNGAPGAVGSGALEKGPAERASGRVLAQISALLIGTFLIMLGSGFLGASAGMRLGLAGIPAILTGLVMAGFFAGMTAGSFFAHLIVRRAGHIRAFSVYATIFSAATLLHGFVLDATLWLLLRAVAGFCAAGVYICIESWLNARSNNANRGTVLSLYMIISYLGQGLSPLLLNLPDPTGFSWFVIASVLLSLSLVPVALTRMPQPDLPSSTPYSLGRIYRASPLGVLGVLLGGFINGAFWSLMPTFGQKLGLSVGITALLMSIAIFGGLLSQWPIGRLSDKVDRRKVILIIGIVTAGGAGMMAEAGPSPLFLFFGALVFGAGAFLLYPLSVAHANDFIPAEDLVPASASLVLITGLGALLGPLGAGPILQFFGPAGYAWMLGAVALAVAAFAVWRIQAAPPAVQAEKSTFQTLNRTTAVAFELHPDVIEDDQYAFDFEADPAPAVASPAGPDDPERQTGASSSDTP